YAGAGCASGARSPGLHVRLPSRSAKKLAPLAALGAEVVALDAAKARQFGPALAGLRAPTIIYSIPPVTDLPGGGAIKRAAEAAGHVGCGCFIYLSSAALY